MSTRTRAPAAVHSGRTSFLSAALNFPFSPLLNAHPLLNCLRDWASKCSATTPTKLTTGRGGTLRRTGSYLLAVRILGWFARLPGGSVSRRLYMLSPNSVVSPTPGLQRNFPEAPGRVAPRWKKRRRRWAEGRRGSGKEESCFLFPIPTNPDCSLAPPVPLRSWEEGTDLRILLCTV